jgi:hypothetical protein
MFVTNVNQPDKLTDNLTMIPSFTIMYDKIIRNCFEMSLAQQGNPTMGRCNLVFEKKEEEGRQHPSTAKKKNSYCMNHKKHQNHKDIRIMKKVNSISIVSSSSSYTPNITTINYSIYTTSSSTSTTVASARNNPVSSSCSLLRQHEESKDDDDDDNRSLSPSNSNEWGRKLQDYHPQQKEERSLPEERHCTSTLYHDFCYSYSLSAEINKNSLNQNQCTNKKSTIATGLVHSSSRNDSKPFQQQRARHIMSRIDELYEIGKQQRRSELKRFLAQKNARKKLFNNTPHYEMASSKNADRKKSGHQQSLGAPPTRGGETLKYNRKEKQYEYYVARNREIALKRKIAIADARARAVNMA